MLKTHPQVMPYHKQRHLTGGPADESTEPAQCPRGRNLLEPQPGPTALTGVEPLERTAAAIEVPGVVFRSHYEGHRKRPGARLVRLAASVVAVMPTVGPAGIPQSFKIIER